MTHTMDISCYIRLTQPQGNPFVQMSFEQYLKLYLLTVAIEMPFYYFALRSPSQKKNSWLKASFLLNLATHPIVTFLIPSLVSRFHGRLFLSETLGEIFAPVVEAGLLIIVWKLAPVRASVFSLVANLSSWWLGAYCLSLVF